MDCVVCGGKNLKDKYPDKAIRECCGCGHVFHDTETESFDPVAIYDEGYYVNSVYGNYRNDEMVIKLNFSHRRKEILRYVSGGDLLEIGSAYGFFLSMMRDRFRLTGFEVSPVAARYASGELGLNVITGDFLKHEVSDRFDAICMYDTIEHLVRPDLFLKKMNALTSPGGYLFITTADISSLLARVMGRNWRLIHPPFHIHYFSKKTLISLLESSGFTTVNVTYIPVWRSIHQIVSAFLKIRLFEKMPMLGVPFQTFDIMSVVARRK